jgi:predicted TIM-barrel fold metal-dependent hydrolase
MSESPLSCPPPDPHPRSPRFTVPANSCDCHAHIIGPADKYPFVSDRSYTPPDALLPDYLNVLAALGLQRAVLVQPSVHGTDNTVMMEAIAAAKNVSMRAVVVVPTTVTEDELLWLHQRGARGVRLNLIYSGGATSLAIAAEIAAKIRNFGWHLQFLVDVSELGRELAQLSKLNIPMVFDHMGHLPAVKTVRDPGFQSLLELVRQGNTWVKLSGAYRLTSEEYPYLDVRPFVDELLDACPQRLLWGTDWPHTVCRVHMPNDGDLLDLLHMWIPDRRSVTQTLVENPAHLYGF